MSSDEEEDFENKATAFELINALSKCGRPRDTVFFLQKIAGSKKKIPENILHIFVESHKAFVNEKRNAINVIDESIAELDPEEDGAEETKKALLDYRKKRYDDLYFFCERVISIIDQKLLPNATEPTTRFVYYKLKGDFHRYQTEFAQPKGKKFFAEQSRDAYQNAMLISKDRFDPASKENLGLIMNVTILMYEFMDQKVEAIKLLEKTFNDVKKVIDSDINKYYSSRPYLQMIKDNYCLWRHETVVKDEEPEQNEAETEQKKEETNVTKENEVLEKSESEEIKSLEEIDINAPIIEVSDEDEQNNEENKQTEQNNDTAAENSEKETKEDNIEEVKENTEESKESTEENKEEKVNAEEEKTEPVEEKKEENVENKE